MTRKKPARERKREFHRYLTSAYNESYGFFILFIFNSLMLIPLHVMRFLARRQHEKRPE